MNWKTLIFATTGMLVAIGNTGHSASDRMKPDSLLLKNGDRIDGLIVENTADHVTIQNAAQEITVQKSEILRIVDEPDDATYFAQIHRKGSLPPWRVIVNDLRLHDKIRTFEQIPATVIDNGVFENVPYQSFRINGDIELNVYGDPEDPVGLEVGIYGRRKNDKRVQAMLRQYLAGYLTTRDEIAALYSIPPEGGTRAAGPMRLAITLPDAPDAYGAWWLGIYNPTEVKKVRLTDQEYARLVRPVDEVFDKDGNVLSSAWQGREINLSRRISQLGDDAKVFLRGFYRDANGRFQLIFEEIQNPL